MLLNKFLDYISENELATKDDKILLTVSGGVDSMVMMRLFVEAGFNVGIAHCNFQLRGEESDDDEVLVETQAAQFGLQLFNKRFDTAGEIERSGDSTQMVARRLRYEWFNSICEQHGYTHLAIAHHADDSVETFFINLVRGTGLRGLTGINVINGKIIRPLLFSTRKDIIEYAVSNKVPYREDSSNSSTKYLRNKIRLGIIPRIKEMSPNFSDTMRANVERLTAAQNFIDAGIDMIAAQIVSVECPATIIDPSKLTSQVPLNFIIYELMSRRGFRGDVIDGVCVALSADNGTGKRFYSKDNVAYVDRGRIIIEPITDEDTCSVEVTKQTKRVHCGGHVITFEHIDVDDLDSFQVPANVAIVDEARLDYPLSLRRWNEGDFFLPFGMTGHKKISDTLVDLKVSLPDKKRQFVLTSSDDIVWLVGRRMDERYKITSKTTDVLRITKVPL
ncbi:MAG: tRNA lysidine(34) synthetase TilS [Rikenellaceae bacterium]